MTTARDALNDLKWHRGELARAVVSYLHRGAPADTATVRGADIAALRRSFFDLRDGASIPYHRVLRIEVDGREVWARARSGPGAGPGAGPGGADARGSSGPRTDAKPGPEGSPGPGGRTGGGA